MRRETASERQAWTEHVTGSAEPTNKMGNKRTYSASLARWFDSKWEAEYAERLNLLYFLDKIRNLRFQVPIVLVPGDGKLRAVTYIADYEYYDLDGTRHVVDAKGFKSPVYRLKKRMAALLLNLEIEEVYRK